MFFSNVVLPLRLQDLFGTNCTYPIKKLIVGTQTGVGSARNIQMVLIGPVFVSMLAYISENIIGNLKLVFVYFYSSIKIRYCTIPILPSRVILWTLEVKLLFFHLFSFLFSFSIKIHQWIFWIRNIYSDRGLWVIPCSCFF